MRYDSKNWREVPWDYGEEHAKVNYLGAPPGAPVMSALMMPANTNRHHGGMSVSLKGHLAVSCLYGAKVQVRKGRLSAIQSSYTKANKQYEPRLYPGRIFTSKGTLIHVWNRHGQLIREDAVPGLGDCYGVEIDTDESLYVLNSATEI